MNRNVKRGGKMAWVIMAWVMVAVLSGCVSIPYDGKKVYKTPTVTTRTMGTEGKLEFHPEVERRGDVVRLRLVADGMFLEETTTTRTCKVQKQKLAVGLCPGFADCFEDEEAQRYFRSRDADPGLFSFFMFCLTGNVMTFGTVNLSALLVEPFLPPREHFTVFRQCAFVGFCKYKQGEEEVVEKPIITRRAVKKTKPLGQIAMWFDAEPRFWESSKQDGDTLVLRGVEAGRHEGKLYIKSVPAGHEYEKELNKMEWVPIDVEIPE